MIIRLAIDLEGLRNWALLIFGLACCVAYLTRAESETTNQQT